MLKEKQEINLDNVMLIAQTLLELDISAYFAKNAHALEMEFNLLRKYQHDYHYVSSEEPQEGFSTVEWIEHIAKQFIQQTRCCVDQLTDEAKKQLFKHINFCYQRHEL